MNNQSECCEHDWKTSLGGIKASVCVCKKCGISNTNMPVNNQSELVREKLADDLVNYFDSNEMSLVNDGDVCGYLKLADFILARDKKNAEPLVKHNSNYLLWTSRSNELYHAREAIDETLKNLGAE